MSTGKAASELVPLLSKYLDDLAERTHTRLGDVAGVAVTLGIDGAPHTIGSSTELALQVDLVQFAVGTGPCLAALSQGISLYVADLAADDRWGTYGPQAAALGARSCVSIPVVIEDRPAAVVKAYSGEVDGLSADQQELVRSVCGEVSGGIGLATVLAAQATELDDRVAAMDARRTIDMAIGMVMQRTGCDAETAFSLLRRQSQNANIKIRDAARDLIAGISGGSSPTAAPFTRRNSAR